MQWAQKQKGFTIVELLIVIVVIAILAAITIVAYNGIQDRAKTSASQAATAQATKKVMAYAVDHADTYPDDLAGLAAILGVPAPAAGATSLTGPDGATYQYWRSTDLKSYCITATKNNISHFSSNSSANASSGACAGHAANGGVTIVNRIRNPSFEVNANDIGYMGGTNTNSSSERTTDWAASGTRSVKVTKTTVANAPQGVKLTLPDALEVGDVVRWGVTIRNSSANANAKTFQAYGERGSPSYTGYSPGTTITLNPAASGRLTGQLTITSANAAGAFGSGFGVLPTTSFAIGESYFVDAFVVTINNELPSVYVDGSTTNWAWAGAEHASTSSGPMP
jgi:prepilin-type N-terminal cleavage/methylation domain-containing protein